MFIFIANPKNRNKMLGLEKKIPKVDIFLKRCNFSKSHMTFTTLSKFYLAVLRAKWLQTFGLGGVSIFFLF